MGDMACFKMYFFLTILAAFAENETRRRKGVDTLQTEVEKLKKMNILAKNALADKIEENFRLQKTIEKKEKEENQNLRVSHGKIWTFCLLCAFPVQTYLLSDIHSIMRNAGKVVIDVNKLDELYFSMLFYLPLLSVNIFNIGLHCIERNVRKKNRMVAARAGVVIIPYSSLFLAVVLKKKYSMILDLVKATLDADYRKMGAGVLHALVSCLPSISAVSNCLKSKFSLS